MTTAEAVARALFREQFMKPEADLGLATDAIAKVLAEDKPHYVIYFMGTGEIGSTLYDSHDACVEDCETEMIPVPVYGIPWPDPNEDVLDGAGWASDGRRIDGSE